MTSMLGSQVSTATVVRRSECRTDHFVTPICREFDKDMLHLGPPTSPPILRQGLGSGRETNADRIYSIDVCSAPVAIIPGSEAQPESRRSAKCGGSCSDACRGW